MAHGLRVIGEHSTIMAEYVVGWGYSADTLEFRPLEFEAPKSQVQRDRIATTKSSLSCQRLIRGDGTMRMIQSPMPMLQYLKPHKSKAIWKERRFFDINRRNEGYCFIPSVDIGQKSLPVCMASIDKLFWLCSDASLDSLRSKSNKLAAVMDLQPSTSLLSANEG
ncbi:hypothetical protein Cgig2_018331 [Carnegiea gigantea]|uniref:Uncharacterized protein n=1 Tax=Carnegiea gigantea TaxID=171969 RepID=A0A9Q1L055_9CARY|nr:hypothetical protein Cgig2_018331 [Carnegiea gigantea]